MSRSHKMKNPDKPWQGVGAESKASNDSSMADLSPAGKVIALAWFNSGARTLEETARAFRAHPGWRGA